MRDLSSLEEEQLYSLDFLQVALGRTFFPILGRGWLKKQMRETETERKKTKRPFYWSTCIDRVTRPGHNHVSH